MTTLAALAAELAARSDAELLRLLVLRPDAITPQAPTFASLAGRLSSVHSLRLALDSLSLPQLQLLSSLAGARGPAAPHATTERYADALHALHARALVIPDPVPHQDAYDGGPRQFSPLTFVGEALGDRPRVAAGFDVDPPPLEGVQLRTALRENAAASAAETLLRTTAGLLGHMRDTPLAALRDGTAGARPVRQLAAALDIDEAQACFYLELAAEAGFVAFDPATRHWFAADSPWPLEERPDQWLALISAWLGCNRVPVLMRAASGAVRALAPAEEHAGLSGLPYLSGLRATVLSAVAGGTLPTDTIPADAATGPLPGTALAPSLESVLHLLAWRHPRQAAATASHVPAILAEMELLGLTGAGAPSVPGSNIAAQDWAAARTALAAMLPAPIEHFLLQGDLTAVAPGYLSPEVAARLATLAVPDGRGAAGMFRFSESSLRRATAGGWQAADIMDFLHRHSSTGVPQSLDYLVHEAARTTVQTRADGPKPAVNAPTDTTPAASAPRTNTISDPPAVTEAAAESARRAQLAVLRGAPERPVEGAAGGAAGGTSDGGTCDGGFGVALVLEQLRTAVTAGAKIRLLAVTGSGEVERLLVQPTSFAEGLLRARLAETGAMRSFNVHRIVGVEEPARQDKGKS